MSLAADLWRILTPSQRRAVLLAQALALAMALATLLGVTAIAPFFAVLGNAALAKQHGLLHWAAERLSLPGNGGLLGVLGLAFVGAVIAANIIRAAGTHTLERLALRIGNELQAALFAEYLGRPYLFHATHHGTTLFNHVVFETARVSNGILQNGFLLIAAATTGALIIGWLLWLDPFVCLALLLALAGAYLGVYLHVQARMLRAGRLQSAAWEERARLVMESFAATRERAFLEDHRLPLEALERCGRQIARCATQVHAAGHLPQHVLECVAAAALVGVALLTQHAAAGRPPWGELTLIAFAAYRLLPCLQQVFSFAIRIRAEQAAFLQIAPALRSARGHRRSAPRESSPARPWWRERPREEIRLESVSFRYPGAAQPALDGIDLRIAAGTTLGVLGSNGGGKSTLLDVLAGLLEPSSGTLRVDGIDIDGGNRHAWRSRLAYVPQQLWIADATLEQNIAFGTDSRLIDRARLTAVLRAAQLERLVAELPQGIHQPLGERGITLSGGYRQRVGIARALYREASVLLLDEPAGALDELSSAELLALLRRLHGSCTIVLVTHDERAAQCCDQIVRLASGRLDGVPAPRVRAVAAARSTADPV